MTNRLQFNEWLLMSALMVSLLPTPMLALDGMMTNYSTLTDTRSTVRVNPNSDVRMNDSTSQTNPNLTPQDAAEIEADTNTNVRTSGNGPDRIEREDRVRDRQERSVNSRTPDSSDRSDAQ